VKEVLAISNNILALQRGMFYHCRLNSWLVMLLIFLLRSQMNQKYALLYKGGFDWYVESDLHCLRKYAKDTDV